MAEPRFPRPGLAVVKVGSNTLRAADGRLDRDQVATIAAMVADARQEGVEVVVVSSGAVAAGIGLLGLPGRPTDMTTLQSAASVGQGELINTYQRHLAERGIPCGQVLLTQDDFVRRGRYLNARSTLRRLLALGAVPVVNENDAVATEELAYGDNDRLASLVASMLDADVLVILSDVAGLHTADPRTVAGAFLVSRVDDPADVDLESLGGVGSFVGKGGMRSKVDAARVAVLSGCQAVVADGRRPGVLADVLSGEDVGTWFVAQPRRLEARRLWIGFALDAHGRIHVDAGAAEALTGRGTSLLAVGVTRVAGGFATGDAVEVVAPDGAVIARGLVNYDADDLAKVAGMRTADAGRELGDRFTREVIHRDDLVVLASERT
ncbi:MAG: glutamate 5-kinase [Nitriliruptorales bacterium]